MQNLKKLLTSRLKDAGKIAFLGVGSELRGDDAAGMLLAENLKKTLNPGSRQFKVFAGGTAPENLTGQIKKFHPTHVIIADCAKMGKKPGETRLIDLNEESAGISFSTHKLPLKILADYLEKSIGCQIILIGIQPHTLAFEGKLSKEVADAIRRLTSLIPQSLPS